MKSTQPIVESAFPWLRFVRVFQDRHVLELGFSRFGGVKFRRSVGFAGLATIFIAAFGGVLNGEEVVEKMSMRQVVGLVLENNHDISVQNLNRLIESERIEMARAAFDISLEGSYAYQYIDTPQNAQEFVATGGGAAIFDENDMEVGLSSSLLSSPSIFEQRNNVAKLALQQRLFTGTTVEVGSSLRILDNTLNRSMPPGLFNPEYETFTGITLTQPLLRDFGSNANLAEVRIAKSNKRLADLEWRSRTAALTASAMKLYYDVIFTHENMLIQRDAIKLAEQLFEENKKRSVEGVIPPNDVLIAEGAVYKRREEALLAENQYVERQNALQLLFTVGDEADRQLRILPSDSLKDSVKVSQRTSLVEMAQDSRYDILQALEVVQQREDQSQFASNQVRPRLDLIGSAGYHGLAGSTSNSYREAANGQAPEWTVGLSFSVPLEFKRARAAARLAKHREAQAHIDVSRVRAQIGLELDTVLNRIETDRQRLITARKGREVASSAMDGEVKRLGEGVSTSFQVLQYQTEYSQTRSRELAALADLNKDQLDLWLVTGQLLDRMGIVIDGETNERPVVGLDSANEAPSYRAATEQQKSRTEIEPVEASVVEVEVEVEADTAPAAEEVKWWKRPFQRK